MCNGINERQKKKTPPEKTTTAVDAESIKRQKKNYAKHFIFRNQNLKVEIEKISRKNADKYATRQQQQQQQSASKKNSKMLKQQKDTTQRYTKGKTLFLYLRDGTAIQY